MFYIGSQKITPGLFSKSEGQTIICLNKSGSDIQTGEKVFIAANTNYVLISQNNFSTSVGFTGIATENISNNSSGRVSSVLSAPSSGLELYSRIDNKATVAGFYTDGNGTKYAICVVDAQYRSETSMRWSNDNSTDTLLPNYTRYGTLESLESGSYNTDLILSNYNSSQYPSFEFARNALSLTYNGTLYKSCLPNTYELQVIYNDRIALDNLDPTLNNYSERSLTIFNCGGSYGIWSSNEISGVSASAYTNTGTVDDFNKISTSMGVIPIVEIPVAD